MALSQWCPEGATDSESDPGNGGSLGDLGDFEPPNTPEYTSQKNMVDVGWDPRTGVMLMTQGGFGTFGEDPPTPMKVLRSTDCGRTWTQVADFENIIGSQYGVGPFGGLHTTFYVPQQIVYGANPHEWLLFDYVGGYYLSDDDGETWTERQYSGVDGGFTHSTPPASGFEFYYGMVGLAGEFNTRPLPAWNYLEGGTIGYVFAIPAWDDAAQTFTVERLGIRRSLGPNGSLGWEDSLPPATGDPDWGWLLSIPHPPIHGANGRWIVFVDFGSTQSFTFEPEFADVEIPAMRINDSPDLNPTEWGAPFWPVSREWFMDVYGGTVASPYGSSTNRRVDFPQGHGKLKFIPNPEHPAGGRWWLLGLIDTVIFSDDNGDTWSNALADHTGLEADLHPILNYRASHALSYRFMRPRITDIVQSPLDPDRLIAVGVTWDQAGIDNRLAVFCCSMDGGDTWTEVKQLPIRLSNIGAIGSSDHGTDSPAVARHIFPCLT